MRTKLSLLIEKYEKDRAKEQTRAYRLEKIELAKNTYA